MWYPILSTPPAVLYVFILCSVIGPSLSNCACPCISVPAGDAQVLKMLVYKLLGVIMISMLTPNDTKDLLQDGE